MGFFKNKEDMFNHRADRFHKDGDDHAKKGGDYHNQKAEWCYEQEKENREKANKYKGQEGW